MAEVGIGILGAARITEKALVVPARDTPGCHLAAIAARDPSRAQAYARAQGVAEALGSYQDVVKADAVDLVYNPLPINLHAEWSIKALQAGKHVLCEKPFAMNSDEARAMVAAAEASGTRLIEAFHYRYHPAFETCLSWLAADEIGELREIHAAFDVTIKDTGNEIRHQVETGGGAMMDLGCYPLHWALSVTGEAPVEIEARATLTKSGVDESLVTDLTFPSGVVAHLHTDMGPQAKLRANMHLIGSRGEIRFNNPLAPQNPAMPVRLESSNGRVAEIPLKSTYAYQLEAVIAAIQSGDPLPTEGEMILRQQAALDGIYAAAGLRHLRYLT